MAIVFFIMEIRYLIAAKVKFDLRLDPHVQRHKMYIFTSFNI